MYDGSDVSIDADLEMKCRLNVTFTHKFHPGGPGDIQVTENDTLHANQYSFVRLVCSRHLFFVRHQFHLCQCFLRHPINDGDNNC
jgi:hypothetical protein